VSGDRILVVAVNPMSTTSSNGKTYASIFKGYPKERLAQLYFHREVPTSDVCDRYFRISDEDILRHFTGRRLGLGREVHLGDAAEKIIPGKLHEHLRKSSAVRFVRSLIWRAVDIRKPEMLRWLDDFHPDILFFCGGDANYLYDKVLKIASRYGAEIIFYITDDYVLPFFSLNPFFVLNRLWTRLVFKRMCRASGLVVTIGEKMARVYKERYGIESYPMMNMVPIEIDEVEDLGPEREDLVFVFAGGLHTRRWKTLSLIADGLDRLAGKGLKARLDIYAPSVPGKKALAAIDRGNRARYRGALDEQGVRKVLREADVLVHVESFKPSSRRVTRLSVSTKIPEYMAMGKCILAFGPRDVASIEYIKETGAGYVVDSTRPADVDGVLTDIILNPGRRRTFARKALDVAKINHDEKIKRVEFHRLLLEWRKRPDR
jgi:hypothetical protein